MALLVARKFLSLVVVLLVVSVVVYFLGRGVVPGDVATLFVGEQDITPKEEAEVRHRLGLDKPIYLAYVDWLSGALTGDLGSSPITGRPVTDELKQQLPVSLELATIALILTTLIGVPLGVTAAVHAGGSWDSVIRISLLTVFGIPSFVSAIVLLLVAALYFEPLYETQYIPFTVDPIGNLRSLFLPAVAVALPPTAVTLQLTRATMMEALGEPHITMAFAKGATRRNIQYIHALKNALPTILTLLAFLFGLLIGGVVVVETVFSLPGLGRGMITAINERDFQLLVPQTVILAGIFVTANTLVEVVHPIIDPRLRPS